MSLAAEALGVASKAKHGLKGLPARNRFTAYEDWLTFEPGETWSPTGGTVSSDDTHVRSGTQALKLSATNTAVGRADHTTTVPRGAILEFDFYVEDVAAVTRMEFLLTADNYTTFFRARIAAAHLRDGWNRFYLNPTDFQRIGSPTPDRSDWWGMNKVRIAVTAAADATANVWLDRVRAYQSRAAVTFTFDDGRLLNHTNAMPILAEYGWAATLYLVTDSVGQGTYTASGTPAAEWDTLTLAQLREMHAMGWDISSHTHTHADLTALTEEQVRTELETARDWLLDNGFGDGAHYLATPYGRRDTTVVQVAQEVYHNLRDASEAGHQGWESPFHREYVAPTYEGASTRYTMRAWDVLGDTTFETFQGWVDTAVEFGLWLILVCHDVGPSNWSTVEQFRAQLEYLDSLRDDLDVVTMSQFYRSVAGATLL